MKLPHVQPAKTWTEVDGSEPRVSPRQALGIEMPPVLLSSHRQTSVNRYFFVFLYSFHSNHISLQTCL